MRKNCCLKSFLSVDCWKTSYEIKPSTVACWKKILSELILSNETLSFEKICSIEVDPLIANIAIYNDSLTLTSVIFTTFLHFARKFRMLSEKPFTHFLLCLCKRIVSGLIFLQFSSKIRQKLLPLASFEFLLQLWGKKIFVYVKILILFSLVY